MSNVELVQEPEGKFCNAALVSTMKHGDRKKTGSNKQEVTNRSMEDMAQKTEVLQIHTVRRIRRRRLMRRGGKATIGRSRMTKERVNLQRRPTKGG